MASLNKAAAAIVGTAIAALLATAVAWSVFGFAVKAYLPNELGYSWLGWVHAGRQQTYGVGLPKWAGWQGFAAALNAPFRHRKVYLKAGQKIVADYHVNVERGSLTITIYRTNLFTLLQGVMVEDLKTAGFKPGVHEGVFEYTAPADGIYQFKYDVWWDREASRRTYVPLGNYEVVYDIRWRLERPGAGGETAAAPPMGD